MLTKVDTDADQRWPKSVGKPHMFRLWASSISMLSIRTEQRLQRQRSPLPCWLGPWQLSGEYERRNTTKHANNAKKNGTQIAIQLQYHQNISSFGLSRDPERVWFTYWFRVSKFKRCLLRAMNIMNYETSKPTASEFSSSETSSPGRTPKASWQNVRQLLALQTVACVDRVARVLLVALFTRKLNEDEWGVIKWHSWS